MGFRDRALGGPETPKLKFCVCLSTGVSVWVHFTTLKANSAATVVEDSLNSSVWGSRFSGLSHSQCNKGSFKPRVRLGSGPHGSCPALSGLESAQRQSQSNFGWHTARRHPANEGAVAGAGPTSPP